MNLNKFVYELKKLNRDTEIRVGIDGKDTLAYSRIFSGVPISELVLPEGYTNKGNYILSEDGEFELFVDGLANVIAGHAYCDYGFVTVSPCANYEEVAIAIQKINPDAEIRILNPDLDVPFDEYISSNVDISDLALPIGFYYDKEKGISTINNAGNFNTIMFIREEKMDESIEILPRYDFKADEEKQYRADMYRMHPQLDPNKDVVKKSTKIIQKIKSRFHK